MPRLYAMCLVFHHEYSERVKLIIGNSYMNFLLIIIPINIAKIWVWSLRVKSLLRNMQSRLWKKSNIEQMVTGIGTISEAIEYIIMIHESKSKYLLRYLK